MATSVTPTASRLRRVVPTLLGALAPLCTTGFLLPMVTITATVMTSQAYAAVASPTFSRVAPTSTIGTNTRPEFQIQWPSAAKVTRWDPTASTDLEVYVQAATPNIGTDTPVTIAAADVQVVDSRTWIIKIPAASAMANGDNLYVNIPATAHVRGADAVAYTAVAGVTNAAPLDGLTILYTKVPAAIDKTGQNTNMATYFKIQSPVDESATTSRRPVVVVSYDLTSTNNKYKATDSFTWTLQDNYNGGGYVDVGTTTFLFGTPTNNTVLSSSITPTVDLQPGKHVLQAILSDGAGNTLTTSAVKLLVWDAPTINGLDVVTNTVSVTNLPTLTLTGSNFNLDGTVKSTVTMTVDGASQTVNTSNGSAAWTTTMSSGSSLTPGSHTVVLTQTETGASYTNHPTVVTTFTYDNSTVDSTAPLAPTITFPVPATQFTNVSGASSLTPSVTISGCEIGSTVTLQYSTDNGTTWSTLGTTKTAASDTVTFAAADWTGGATLNAGTSNALQAKCTDPAGNASSYSTAVTDITFGTTSTPVMSVSSQSTSTTFGGQAWQTPTITLVRSSPVIFEVDPKTYSSAGAGTAVNPDGAGTTNRTLTAAKFTVTGGTLNAVYPTGTLAALSATQVTGTALAEDTTNKKYYLCVTPTASQVTVALTAGSYTVNSAANTATSMTVTVDTTKPVVSSVALTSGGSSLTAVATNPTLTISFSEAMSNVTTFAIGQLSGAAAAGASLSAPTWASDGKSVSYTVTTVATGALTVAANAITTGLFTDMAGNVLSAAAPSASVTKTVTAAPTWTVVYDATTPATALQVTSTVTAGTPTKTNPIPVTFTFPAAVTGFTTSNLAFTNCLPTVTGAVPAAVGGTAGTTYTLNVTPGEGSTAVRVQFANATGITDANGYAGGTLMPVISGSYLSRIYDSTAPRVVSFVSTAASAGTNKTSIPCAVTFSEPVSGLTAAKFAVDNCTVSGLTPSTGSSASWAFNLLVGGSLSTAKTVRCILPGSTVTSTIASDAAGNLSGGYTMKTWSFDPVKPILAGTVVSGGDGSNLSHAQVKISGTKSGGAYTFPAFDVSKISLANANLISIAKHAAAGGFDYVTVDFTYANTAGNGPVIVNVAAGAVTDASGNTTDALAFPLPNASDG